MNELKEKKRDGAPQNNNNSPVRDRNMSPSRVLKSETYLKEVMKLQNEIKQLKRENKTMKNDYEKKLMDKATKMNDILTEFENQKTDMEHNNNLLNKVQEEKAKNEREMDEYKNKLEIEINERLKISSQLQEKLGEQIQQKVEI